MKFLLTQYFSSNKEKVGRIQILVKKYQKQVLSGTKQITPKIFGKKKSKYEHLTALDTIG